MSLITINGSSQNVTATADDIASVTNLRNLHDVNMSNLLNNDLLSYNSALDDWENTNSVTISGNLGVNNDASTDGVPLTVSTNVNSLPGNQQNAPVTAYFLKEASNSSRRMRMLLGTSNAGTPNYTISLDSRFQNSEKKFRIQANSDDDLGSGNLLQEMIYNTTTGLKTTRMRGAIDLSDVDAVNQPNALRMEVNANGETIANFMTGTLYHGATGVNGAAQTFSFQAKNDADGETGVGQLLAEYRTDDNNRMTMRARTGDFSGESALTIDFDNVRADVPYKNYATSLTTYTGVEQIGMTIYDTDDNKLKTYDGTTWQAHW